MLSFTYNKGRGRAEFKSERDSQNAYGELASLASLESGRSYGLDSGQVKIFLGLMNIKEST